MKNIIQQSFSLSKELAELDTTCVSDAMDRLGILGGLENVKPVNIGNLICGPAFTVHYVPCGMVKGTVGDFLDDVAPGQVVVIDNAGRTYCTVWGDIMTYYAQKKNITGTVIDGVCRDIPTLRKLNYPIFTKGYYMVTGKDRVEVDAINVPVAVSGIHVKPGDIILGDDTGVVAVPLERAADVLEIAREIAEKEEQIMAEIKRGKPLAQARASAGYHSLQTSPKYLV